MSTQCAPLTPRLRGLHRKYRKERKQQKRELAFSLQTLSQARHVSLVPVLDKISARIIVFDPETKSVSLNLCYSVPLCPLGSVDLSNLSELTPAACFKVAKQIAIIKSSYMDDEKKLFCLIDALPKTHEAIVSWFNDFSQYDLIPDYLYEHEPSEIQRAIFIDPVKVEASYIKQLARFSNIKDGMELLREARCLRNNLAILCRGLAWLNVPNDKVTDAFKTCFHLLDEQAVQKILGLPERLDYKDYSLSIQWI